MGSEIRGRKTVGKGGHDRSVVSGVHSSDDSDVLASPDDRPNGKPYARKQSENCEHGKGHYERAEVGNIETSHKSILMGFCPSAPSSRSWRRWGGVERAWPIDPLY